MEVRSKARGSEERAGGARRALPPGLPARVPPTRKNASAPLRSAPVRSAPIRAAAARSIGCGLFC